MMTETGFLPANQVSGVLNSGTAPMVAAVGYGENPAPRLEALYRKIYLDRMQDVPVVNPAIEVEAIGFHEWEGHWLGILLTPWFMNLLVLPKIGSPWPALKTGKDQAIAIEFPHGSYRFLPRMDEELGSYLCCSLASPVKEWRSHIEAAKTARDVMQMLKTLPVKNVQDDGDETTPQTASGCSISRRAFLGG